uniref:HTH psq-type domain-containing protein n=1 Tax=Chelydra serpentina TaxID=8475 RepID=A0A8C3RYM9_CHESE
VRPIPPATSSGAQPKEQRSVPTLEEKLDVLDLLKGGMSVASVARKYGRNESSIRAIKIRETEIHQAVASSAPRTAKVTSQVLECIVQVARQVGGDGFVDILKEEIEELIEGH